MFILLRYLAFNDALSLYFWNLSHFIESSFHIDIQNYNLYQELPEEQKPITTEQN